MKKKIIKSLIKDNLIHMKLMTGLMDLGFDSGHFYLNLSSTILDMMGLDLQDKKFGEVEKLYLKVEDINILIEGKKLDKLAKSIYRKLKAKKFD